MGEPYGGLFVIIKDTMRLYKVFILMVVLTVFFPTGVLLAEINSGADIRTDHRPMRNERYRLAQRERPAEAGPSFDSSLFHQTDDNHHTVPPLPETPPVIIPPNVLPTVPPPVNDPFHYQTPDGNTLIPAKSSSLPQGIQIVGVLIMEDKKLPPVAAVKMPPVSGAARSSPAEMIHYLREREMLEVHRSLLAPGASARTKNNDGLPEMLFLEIYKIAPYHIEVHSKDNFEDKHIIR